ncbi:hypothetical protein GCM10023215_27630 [Pseudonocardia yuanmonensis]|uniref:Uncharacterized protein n=1 Tax=Pseudonocardia yuanmonensis TaxID=1095914 RepID=A0ABP8WH51_9PSEU
MLEQVGEAGAPLGLGPEADVDVHRDADDRGGRVGREEHAQAVGERGPVEFGSWHGFDPIPAPRQSAGRSLREPAPGARPR